LRESWAAYRVNRLALVGLAAVTCAVACVNTSPVLEPGTHAVLFVGDARLGGEQIEVQLVRATTAAGGRPLLLYATGDGGWGSVDRGLFQHLALWGYPLAGFSARRYLEHLGFEPTTPLRVAGDYGALIAFAKKRLDLPADTPTVLVGFSRGSGLAVVAAGQSGLQPLLGGVLAVALTDEEEYVRQDVGPCRTDPARRE
jgi:Bacterial virulence protein (VirJ)